MKLKLNTNRYFSSIQEFYFIKNTAVGSFGIVKNGSTSSNKQVLCYQSCTFSFYKDRAW
jgi:hypothetical protein